MVILTDAQLAAFRDYAARLEYELNSEYGLTVVVEAGMSRLAEHCRSIGHSLSTWLDPQRVELTKANSFSVFLMEGEEIIACQGERVLSTNDLVYDIKTHRLYGDTPKLVPHEVEIALGVEVPVLSGRIGVGGAAWVRADKRNQGIAWYLPRLARTLARRDYLIDWQVGFVPDTPMVMNLVKNVYGFKRASRLLTGRHPGYDGEHPQRLVWMSSWEILEEVAAAVLDQEVEEIAREGSNRLTVV